MKGYDCDNCARAWDGDADWFNLERITYGQRPTRLCSLDCIIEHAWKLREAQPKLSKSKAANG
jgi:hypothetical protein